MHANEWLEKRFLHHSNNIILPMSRNTDLVNRSVFPFLSGVILTSVVIFLVVFPFSSRNQLNPAVTSNVAEVDYPEDHLGSSLPATQRLELDPITIQARRTQRPQSNSNYQKKKSPSVGGKLDDYSNVEKNRIWWEIANVCRRSGDVAYEYTLTTKRAEPIARKYGVSVKDVFDFFRAGVDAPWRELDPPDKS